MHPPSPKLWRLEIGADLVRKLLTMRLSGEINGCRRMSGKLAFFLDF